MPESLLGQYNDSERQVIIDKQHFENDNADHCEEYTNEIMDYKSFGEDFESYIQYYGQYLEKDSRKYAESTVREYYGEIDILQGNFEKYHGKIID